MKKILAILVFFILMFNFSSATNIKISEIIADDMAIIADASGEVDDYPIEINIENSNLVGTTTQISLILYKVGNTTPLYSTSVTGITTDPGITTRIINLPPLGFDITESGPYKIDVLLSGPAMLVDSTNVNRGDDTRSFIFTANYESVSGESTIPEINPILVVLVALIVVGLIRINA